MKLTLLLVAFSAVLALTAAAPPQLGPHEVAFLDFNVDTLQPLREV